MDLIIVTLLMGGICYLFLLILKQQNDLRERIEQLESENIEQNRKFLRIDRKIKQNEKDINNEKRDNCRENKTSNRNIRRN